MVKPRGDLDLAEEAFGPEARGELGVQNLQCDPAIVLEILRQEHRGHTAPSHFAFNAISVGKRGLESGAKVSH
jgi:hypothetical protein